jgi:hypothetical protein
MIQPNSLLIDGRAHTDALDKATLQQPEHNHDGRISQ